MLICIQYYFAYSDAVNVLGRIIILIYFEMIYLARVGNVLNLGKWVDYISPDFTGFYFQSHFQIFWCLFFQGLNRVSIKSVGAVF